MVFPARYETILSTYHPERTRDGWTMIPLSRCVITSISVLRVCFLVSVLIVKGGMKCTLVVCSIESGCESQIWFGNLG